ncbi:transposase [Streptomyces viridosporus]|uniref:transposase n=1 Tax=Streptomyces viridosporus TaxID=67581 RepID=UPI0036F8FF57
MFRHRRGVQRGVRPVQPAERHRRDHHEAEGDDQDGAEGGPVGEGVRVGGVPQDSAGTRASVRPAGTTLDQLIRIAGARWAIEECFQSAKQECGLDDYQVRRYPGRHRHMTLAMAAHACLTVLRARRLDTGKAETDPLRSSTSASPRAGA